MKILIATLFIFTITSCQSKQKTIDESRQAAIIDSLVAIRMDEVSRQATDDLDRRRSIEVKAKADSIVSARMGATQAPADNTIPNNLQMP